MKPTLLLQGFHLPIGGTVRRLKMFPTKGTSSLQHASPFTALLLTLTEDIQPSCDFQSREHSRPQMLHASEITVQLKRGRSGPVQLSRRELGGN